MPHVYTFPWWVPGVAYGLAAVFVVLAGVVHSKFQLLPVSLTLLVPAACSGGLIGPTLGADRVVLDDERLEQRTGLWFAPTVKGFDLHSVSRILITAGVLEHNQRAMGWMVEHKDGHTEVFDPGDLWELYTEELVPHLRSRGIDVEVRD